MLINKAVNGITQHEQKSMFTISENNANSCSTCKPH